MQFIELGFKRKRAVASSLCHESKPEILNANRFA